MNISIKKIIQFLKRKKGEKTFSYKNPILFHWKLLLIFFVVLLIGVSITGIVLYRFFILEEPSHLVGEKKNDVLFDEKKLDKVLKRIEERKTFEIETGTGTPRFVDPSIPF